MQQDAERIISLQSSGLTLHGLLYRPREAGGAPLLVICDPFAEEKKCAHRPLVDITRGLCAQGYAVLRFDYRGCGDSQGAFGEFTPEDWLQDIHAAIEFAHGEEAPMWIGLAGLRMGASLADAVARDRGDIACLMLWEPIIDGKQYVAQNLRRSMIKAMLTEGKQFDAESVAAKHESDVIDFDGYEVRADTREQLEAIRLGVADKPFTGPTLVLSVGPREDPAAPYTDLAASYPRAAALAVRLEPFWNRIGLTDAGPMIQATLDWLNDTAQTDCC